MCKVIAELGWNFLGNMDLAEKMIVEAANAGASYVKFQSWSVKNLKPGPWDNDGRRQIYEAAELSDDQHRHLIDLCKKNNVEFLTSVFCKEDAEKVAYLGCKTIKIPSTEIANIPLLKFVNQYYEEVFLSTGAATFKEIQTALDLLSQSRLEIYVDDFGSSSEETRPKIVLLHCVSTYPCPFEKVNLPRIRWLNVNFPASVPTSVNVGYSGHAFGVQDAIAALEYDVVLIEKHFTIDNELPGRDNKFAILPKDLRYLCEYIKQRDLMRQTHKGEYDPCEEEARNVYRGRWQS